MLAPELPLSIVSLGVDARQNFVRAAVPHPYIKVAQVTTHDHKMHVGSKTIDDFASTSYAAAATMILHWQHLFAPILLLCCRNIFGSVITKPSSLLQTPRDQANATKSVKFHRLGS